MILVGGSIALLHARRALDRYVYLVGEEHLPAEFLELVDDIRRQPQPTDATLLAADADQPHPALMTATDAAARLGVSTRTVSRFVARGDLERVGRRITAASVHRVAK